MAWGDAFKAAWSKAGDAARSAAAAVATGAKKVGQAAVQAASAAANAVSDAASAVKGAAKGAAKQAARWAAERTGEVAGWAAEKAAQGVQRVGEALAPAASRVADTYRRAKQIFGTKEAGSPSLGCGQCGSQPALAKGDKVTAGLAAIGTTALAAYDGFKDGGVAGGVLGAADQLLELGAMGPGGIERPLWEKALAKEAVKLPQLIKQLPALRDMAKSYDKATGLLKIKKGNLFNLQPGRYKATSLSNRLQMGSKVGKAALKKAGAIGAAMEMGGTVFEYAVDPDKSFLSKEFASDLGKSGVKGVSKGVVDSLIISKSTALGATLGSMVPVVGTVVGAGVGFVSGVALTVLLDEKVDAVVDRTWELAGQAAGAVGDAVSDGLDAAGDAIGDGAKAVWNGAANAVDWATSWW